eukprot:15286553-Alexandrium_andersonii.AAC.1
MKLACPAWLTVRLQRAVPDYNLELLRLSSKAATSNSISGWCSRLLGRSTAVPETKPKLSGKP